MIYNSTTRLLALSLCVSVLFGGLSIAAEWEQYSPYYEDDAWWDISEWMDGNDYNPADEKFGRWDDEVFDSDSSDYDYDDDKYVGYNGTTPDKDRWFYDYWEPSYLYYTYPAAGNIYTTSYSYTDTDGDGRYDYVAIYSDRDADGWYEDVDTYALAAQSKTRDKEPKQTSKAGTGSNQGDTKAAQGDTKAAGSPAERRSSKRYQATGQVDKKKVVNVRGTKHLVVNVKQDDNRMVIVDLGARSGWKGTGVEPGTRITTTGPMTKADDTPVMLAQTAEVGGKTHQIDREPRKFKGTVLSKHESKLRGETHTLVVLKTTSGKQRLVDLGRSRFLNDKKIDLKKDSEITVRGVPMEAKDRPVVMAHSIESGGTSVSIDRDIGAPQKKAS